jgi:DnaJ homologue, subfamily C, member 28, conserved domain
MSTDRYESAVDKAIREAQERGEFDNLPGAGKPLRIRNPNDPNWWVRDWIDREQLEMPLPTSLALRKEAEKLKAEILELRTEDAVRERVEDFNARVLEARRRPVDGPPVVTRTFDVDEMLETWRAGR